ncbi:hypothetical protein BC833DRAFT_647552 [Globomyces pollinis-pini]|nr:hypothetical protein BC833DRAFT_647552 [Globomyces pollinis-pini]
MEIPSELQESIAKANQAVEKAQSDYEKAKSDYDKILAHVTHLEVEYTEVFSQKKPTAAPFEIYQYLNTALEAKYKNLVLEMENVARKEQILVLEKENLARKEQELLKQQTIKLQRDLNQGISTSRNSKSTTRLKSIYGIEAEVHSGTFAILKELKQDRLARAKSILWFEAEAGTLTNWSGESDILTYVKHALMDCLKISPLLQKLSIHREQTFSVAQILGNKNGNRVDATVFVKDTSSITGVTEVKVPGSNMDNIYQIVDYMVDLRNSFNVRFVFGVYTTYEIWKILWFEDSQIAANCDTKDQYDELCLAGSANEYMINKGTVKIFQSKLYHFDDPELIECLATLLYKVSMTPVYTPTNFIDERSRYVYATPTSIEYRSLPKKLECFKYAMPPKQTRNFYILSYFHCGGDGRVALVTSESGNLAVIKFLYQYGDMNDLQKALSDEQNRWQNLWQVQSRIVELNGQAGLLMPFCMTFNPHRSNGFQFSSLQTWNKLSSEYDYGVLSEELEDCVNTQLLDMYQKSPLLAANQALSTVSEKLSSHMDLSFRHIALLPRWNSETDMYDFQAILIDLTRVESELDPQVAQSRAAEGLEKLTIELDQINS